MSIYEYNEEYIKRTLLEDGYEKGFDDGKSKGISVNLAENVEALMRNLNFDLEKACKGLGITVSDYEKAKEDIKSLKQ